MIRRSRALAALLLTSALTALEPHDAVAAQAPQVPVFGGVPSGTVQPAVLKLTLADAIQRGLKNNLAVLIGEHGLQAARGARWRALGDLLPNLSGQLFEVRQRVNLAAFGFSGFPGVPTLVGPFNVFDARVFLSQPIFDLTALEKARASTRNLEAAQYSYRDARDLVVLACANLYLQAVAARSRIDATRAQLETAETLAALAADLKKGGIVAGIDLLRAQVQAESQRQRLIVAQNDFARQKLALARAIGLPLGQEFDPVDEMPYVPPPAMSLEEALALAYRSRADFKSAEARVRAAEAGRRAAESERLPSLHMNAAYGDIGAAPSTALATFSMGATVRVPLLEGGRIHGNVLEADAVLQQHRAEREDLRAQIYYQVRMALLDLAAADERVRVASHAEALAKEELTQARDRFAAGVASNIEVVQAQESLATATESYISSLYAHSVAKTSLARALGIAEEASKRFFEVNR